MIAFALENICYIVTFPLNDYLYDQEIVYFEQAKQKESSDGHISKTSPTNNDDYYKWIDNNLKVELLSKMCVFMQLLHQFSTVARHYWLMNEGIYLYNLLNLTKHKKKLSSIGFFFILGWGVPSVVVMAYVVGRMMHVDELKQFAESEGREWRNEASDCWHVLDSYTVIPQIPVILSVCINTIIFCAVVKTVSSKMKRETKSNFSVTHKEIDKQNPSYMITTKYSAFENLGPAPNFGHF